MFPLTRPVRQTLATVVLFGLTVVPPAWSRHSPGGSTGPVTSATSRSSSGASSGCR